MNIRPHVLLPVLLASVLLAITAHAQGPLSPPSAPEPTMKSLQELWDKLSAQQAALNAATRQNSLILSALGINLPWLFENGPSPLSAALSLAMDPEGRPTVAYVGPLGAIKLARYDGASWTITDVAPDNAAAYRISLAFGPDGRPGMAFQAWAGHIGYVYPDGSSWQIETVDAAPSADEPTLAFTPDGRPAISHYVGSSTNVIYSVRNGTVWTNITVDSGFSPALAFGPDGQPAIAYGSGPWGGPNEIRVNRFDGTNWNFTVADNTSYAGSPKLAFSPAGHPAVTFYVFGSDLYCTQFDGANWNPSVVDSSHPNHFHSFSLAFGPNGQPAIAYAYSDMVGDLDLRFARFNGVWATETVISAGAAGQSASLAFGPDGQPVIACTDYDSGANTARLILAHKGTYYPAP